MNKFLGIAFLTGGFVNFITNNLSFDYLDKNNLMEGEFLKAGKPGIPVLFFLQYSEKNSHPDYQN